MAQQLTFLLWIATAGMWAYSAIPKTDASPLRLHGMHWGFAIVLRMAIVYLGCVIIQAVVK